MAGLFGASMVDHDPLDEIMLTFQRDFGDLKKGEVLRYQPAISNPKHWGVTLALAELRHLTAGSFSLASKVTTTE